jgi:hypothetical protein
MKNKSERNKLFTFAVLAMFLIGGMAVVGAAGIAPDLTAKDGVGDDYMLGASGIPVKTAADLARIGTGVTYDGFLWGQTDYYVMNDITLTGSFTPIGATTTFKGKLYGQNHKITGLSISSGTNVGLFSSTDGATISDLYLENIAVSGSSNVGGLVGNAIATTISNCMVSGSITATSGATSVGGIAGAVTSTTNITGCSTFGTINTERTPTGGIVGIAKDNITLNISNCYNTSKITGAAGGIIGSIAGTQTLAGTANITNCYNTGDITSVTSGSVNNAYAAGIIGGAGKTATAGGNFTVTIANCYNTGKMSSNANGSSATSGGIAATMSGLSTFSATISNCYNVGDITSSFIEVNSGGSGGIIGTAGRTTVINCYSAGAMTVTASGTVTTTNNYVGGIFGDTSVNCTAINSYYLTGKLTRNGSTIADRITGTTYSGSLPTIDGTSVPPRSTDQDSGAKTSAQMAPTQSAASGGTSIYYTGMTNISVAGWNFNTIWLMASGVNNGYPILRNLEPIVTITSVPSTTTILSGSSNSWSYSVTAVAGGTSNGIQYSITGASWLTFSGNILSTGAGGVPDPISGTSQTFNLTITASRTGFPSATQNVSLTVIKSSDPGTLPIPNIVISADTNNNLLFNFNGSASSVINNTMTWTITDTKEHVATETKNGISIEYLFEYSGVYEIKLEIENTAGKGTATKTVVVFDKEPLKEAFRGTLYRTTVEVKSLSNLIFDSEASWLIIEQTGTDSRTGKKYVVISGVTPGSLAYLGLSYDCKIGTDSDNIPWTVKIFAADSDAIANFNVISNVNGLVTVLNNSANAIKFNWFWDSTGNLADKSTSTDPSGSMTHKYTKSGTYSIKLEAVGDQTSSKTIDVTVKVSGGGGEDDDEDTIIGMEWIACMIFGALAAVGYVFTRHPIMLIVTVILIAIGLIAGVIL